MNSARTATAPGAWRVLLTPGAALVLTLLVGIGRPAAQSPPDVTGTVRIDLSRGALSGDVCLRGLPPGDTLTIVLNRSLDIRGLIGATRLTGRSVEEPGGDAVRHVLHRRSRALAAVGDSVCVRYAGREIVHDVRGGHFREDDSSRVIAFNGETVRARGAARWYPALFDPVTGLAAEAATYRLTIECDDCASIYLNGGPPLPGPVGTFESERPRELFLVAGTPPVTRVDGGMILGERVAPDFATLFLEWLARIQRFEEGFVGVPYGAPPVVVRVDPVRAPRRGLIWGFYSDPTLTLTGMSIPEFVTVLEGAPDRARRSIVSFLAHEMAHRYFGWGLGWSSSQRDLFGEPFATYLELKAVRHFVGQAAYRAAVRALIRQARDNDDYVPLHRAGAEDFARDSYRYGHVPARIFALEAIIGEAGMRALLRAMIEAPAAERASADLDFVRRTAMAAGIAPEAWRRWEEACVRPPTAAAECFDSIAP